MFAKGADDLGPADYVAAIATILPLDQAKIVAAQYPCASFEADLGRSACWWAVAAFIRDAMFLCPALHTANVLSTLPRASAPKVYSYMYTQVLAIVDVVDVFKPLRVFHGSELPSVFDLWPVLIGEGEAAMGAWFGTSWMNFAAKGDPNYAGAPAWPSFGAANETVAISTSAKGVALEPLANYFSETCDFWKANPIASSVIWGGRR